MNGNPIWPQYLGTRSQCWERLPPPPNPKQTSSTLEEAVQSPGESGRAPVMGVLLFPITPRPKCPTTRLPRATPTAFWVRGEGARSGLCGKDEGKG